MTIIDHLSVGVPDIDAACAFYDPLLATVGTVRMAANEKFAAYGADRVEFIAILPFDGQRSSGGNGTHICFVAPTRTDVENFHEIAVANGGNCEGAPGIREDYPMPDVYAAYIRDPFGNKLEVVHNGFAR